MADRHICPVCESQGDTITIHDTLYICGEDDCGVHWNPQADDPQPFWPNQYAIGFCPRCKADGRDGRYDDCRSGYECPECRYDWFDSRQDGRVMASRLGFTRRLPSEVFAGHPPLRI